MVGAGSLDGLHNIGFGRVIKLPGRSAELRGFRPSITLGRRVRLQVTEFALGNFFKERTRCGVSEESALDRGPLLKLLEDTGQVLVRVPSGQPLLLGRTILFLDLLEFAKIFFYILVFRFLFWDSLPLITGPNRHP